MTFTIIADRPNLSIFNRVRTADEAKTLASQRRHEGAETVSIYDAAGLLNGADLDFAARSQVDRPNSSAILVEHAIASSPGMTIKLGGVSQPPTPDADEHREAKSRVRIFRAARQRTET